MLSKENVQDIYGLAPMQEGMLIQYARDASSDAYVEQFDFVVEGHIDGPALQRAFDALVAKYDVLRTVFSFRKTDLPRQIVLKSRTAQIHFEDHSDLGAEAALAAVEIFKAEDRQRGFNLSSEMVLRLSLLRVSSARHHMVVTFHHIALDGWCLGVIFRDLFSFYERCCETPGGLIEEREPHPYREYIRWVEGQDRAAAATYWAECLQGYQSVAGIPYFDVPHRGGTQHAAHTFSLGLTLSAALAELAKTRRVTISSLFQTAWGVLLQKYQNSDDVVFGSVVSGRPPVLPGVEEMVGLFINTVPLRVACNGDEAFSAVASRVHERSFQSQQHEFLPLFEIQAQAALKNRLLNHIVAFENYPVCERMKEIGGSGKGLRVLDVKVFEQTNYDFNVIVYPGAEIRVNFTYNRQRFGDEVAAGIERSLLTLLVQVADTPDIAVAELAICSLEDCQRVLHAFNDTQVAYPRDSAIPDLFIDAVRRFPDAPALRYAGETCTYSQVHRIALANAQALRAHGVTRGDCVALLTPRCPEMVFGILGILYLGAAYLPVDPASTAERIEFLLEDAGARLICTVDAYRDRLPDGVATHVVSREPTEADASVMEPEMEPEMERDIDAASAAYVMYTSGSTGQPKGCAVTHRNIARLVCNNDFVAFGPQHRILQTGAPAFDASTFEIWGALLHGGLLCLVDEPDILDGARLKRHLADEGISMLWLTSALFNQLCEGDAQMFRPLEYLLVGGDALSPRHIQRVREANPTLKVINGYGPTENTTFSATLSIDHTYDHRIPIGRPIRNSTAYVVDAAMKLLPPGAYGELCVGGDGVALGYVKRPELTAQKFIADPFQPGGTLYRTGDIVRWLPDGTLDMLGRNDFQVKIRGFRVELGEIERALCALPGIQDALVIACDTPAGKQLHGYYVGDAEQPLQELRGLLGAKLPGYMVPSHYMQLPQMPLTVNGKVDRRALPAIDTGAQRSNAAVALPRSDIETRIAEIVKGVLAIDQIGIHDNFFEVGASSLNLITINNRLKEALSREIPVTVLFEYTSVARLAEYIGDDGSRDAALLARESEELSQAKSALMKTKNLMRVLEGQS